MKRRSFFQLILACCGLSKLKAAKPIHTSGYLQLAGRDYTDQFDAAYDWSFLKQQPSLLEDHAFSNRFLSRYEGRPIPPNVILTQNVGRARATYSNTVPLQTQKLKSTTKDESPSQNYSASQD